MQTVLPAAPSSSSLVAWGPAASSARVMVEIAGSSGRRGCRSGQTYPAGHETRRGGTERDNRSDIDALIDERIKVGVVSFN